MEDNELYVITLTDDEGIEKDFEMIGEAELDGNKYYALIPYSEDNENVEELEYIVLKEVADEDGEAMLVTIDDDGEFEKIAEEFDKLFNEEAND